MSEIKYSHDEYNVKLDYINYLRGYIDSNRLPISGLNTSRSDALQEFVDIHYKLLHLIQRYTETIEDTVTSLRNAGDYIYESDQSST